MLQVDVSQWDQAKVYHHDYLSKRYRTLASKLFTGRKTTMLEVIRDVIEHSPSDGKFLRLGEESAGVSVGY
jgi:hypothetical protein